MCLRRASAHLCQDFGLSEEQAGFCSFAVLTLRLFDHTVRKYVDSLIVNTHIHASIPAILLVGIQSKEQNCTSCCSPRNDRSQHLVVSFKEVSMGDASVGAHLG